MTRPSDLDMGTGHSYCWIANKYISRNKPNIVKPWATKASWRKTSWLTRQLVEVGFQCSGTYSLCGSTIPNWFKHCSWRGDQIGCKWWCIMHVVVSSDTSEKLTQEGADGWVCAPSSTPALAPAMVPLQCYPWFSSSHHGTGIGIFTLFNVTHIHHSTKTCNGTLTDQSSITQSKLCSTLVIPLARSTFKLMMMVCYTLLYGVRCRRVTQLALLIKDYPPPTLQPPLK